MIAEVIVDISHEEVDKVFDYKALDGLEIGSRVIVPFGRMVSEGYVLGLKETSTYPLEKLKPIIRLSEDIPPLTPEDIKLAFYIKQKYHTTMASVLRLFLPSEMRKGKVRKKEIRFFSINENIDIEGIIQTLDKKAPKQADLVRFLRDNGKVKSSIVNEIFSSSQSNSLLEKEIIIATFEVENREPYKELASNKKEVVLSQDQQNAVDTIMNSKSPVLIHGVTGSGKTEVYMTCIEKVLEEGKTAIFLVPEISLTPQMFSRLKGRFGGLCAILHSGLSSGEKFDEWWRLRNGEAKIAIGARSAIFAPLENVGIIVIDEEHDQSYYSETSPRYETHDIALFRSKFNNAKIVFGSATPSIKSYNLAETGEYELVNMPNRINGNVLPNISIVDMRDEVRAGNPTSFSRELRADIEDALKNKNQVMIFLNRRGYSQKIICQNCGYVAKCPNCDVALKYHKYDNLLKCHLCGKTFKVPPVCPECGGANIKYSIMGTQMVVEQLEKLYKDAKILRMDVDSTQTKEAHLDILSKFRSGEADILVGTQMIAKGHDFPNVTLVGILDGDMSLYFNDYRASENTFQLMTQVAGRAGRADKKGKVILQTFSPKNAVLNYAINYDYKGFYKQESNVRKASHFPPFANIIRVMVEGNDETIVINKLKEVYFSCKDVYDKYQKDFVFFNKMKSPIVRINNEFRYQILMRIIGNYDLIENEIYSVVEKNKCKNLRIHMEINPSSLS